MFPSRPARSTAAAAVLALATLLAPTPDAAAQGTQQPRQNQPANRPNSGDQFDLADKNRDGKVSRQEYMQNVRERFAAADKNKDGFISRQEFEAQFPPQAGGDPARRKQMLDQSFGILDVNKDGRISKQEQESVAADLFRALDRDNDGSVTREEAAALRNARPPGS